MPSQGYVCIVLAFNVAVWNTYLALCFVALCRRTVWEMSWHTMLERPRAPTPTTFNIIKAKRRVDAQMQTRHIIYIGHLQPHRCPELKIRMPKCRLAILFTLGIRCPELKMRMPKCRLAILFTLGIRCPELKMRMPKCKLAILFTLGICSPIDAQSST